MFATHISKTRHGVSVTSGSLACEQRTERAGMMTHGGGGEGRAQTWAGTTEGTSAATLPKVAASAAGQAFIFIDLYLLSMGFVIETLVHHPRHAPPWLGRRAWGPTRNGMPLQKASFVEAGGADLRGDPQPDGKRLTQDQMKAPAGRLDGAPGLPVTPSKAACARSTSCLPFSSFPAHLSDLSTLTPRYPALTNTVDHRHPPRCCQPSAHLRTPRAPRWASPSVSSLLSVASSSVTTRATSREQRRCQRG